MKRQWPKPNSNDSNKKNYTDTLPEYLSLYAGSLGRDKMPKKVRRAFKIWSGMIQRCNFKKNAQYPWYGAKGKKVRFTSRQFVSWWIYWIEKIDFDPKDATTDRIDSDGDYCFSNIRMISRSENSKESISRNKKFLEIWKNPVIATHLITGEQIRFSSQKEASVQLGIHPSNVSEMLNGKQNRSRNAPYSLRYA